MTGSRDRVRALVAESLLREWRAAWVDACDRHTSVAFVDLREAQLLVVNAEPGRHSFLEAVLSSIEDEGAGVPGRVSPTCEVDCKLDPHRKAFIWASLHLFWASALVLAGRKPGPRALSCCALSRVDSNDVKNVARPVSSARSHIA